jgi:hypothetical protein
MSGSFKKHRYINRNFERYRRVLSEEEKLEYLRLDSI